MDAGVTLAIALALVLLVGAGLLGETLYRLTSQPLGFDPSGVAVVKACPQYVAHAVAGGPQSPVTVTQ